MGKEALCLMSRLNTEDLNTQVALQCAPLLTGMKISNLLTVGYSKRAAAPELSKKAAVSCCILHESPERTTPPLYIKPTLEAYLSWPEVKVLVEHFGYRGWDLKGILGLVSIRYEEYMEDCAGFPHEIGLLLSYPAKGVTGSIKNSGKNLFYTEYWKVYLDFFECKHTLQSCNHVREHIIHIVSRGMKIDVILRIHNLN